jgi:hypothetical protein
MAGHSSKIVSVPGLQQVETGLTRVVYSSVPYIHASYFQLISRVSLASLLLPSHRLNCSQIMGIDAH